MQKSTNNPMSSFGMIEENTELSQSHTDLAVKNYIENPNLAIFITSALLHFKKFLGLLQTWSGHF